MSVTHQPLSMRPLGQNNSQIVTPRQTTKKLSKVTASADSTGLENDSNAPVLPKHHHSVKKLQTASVVKRNQRERTRVRGVNDGFGNLKKHVPDLKSKSSKVETLRGAIDYIKKLKELLGEDISDFTNNTSGAEIKDVFEDDDDSSSNISDLPDSQFSSPPTPSSSFSSPQSSSTPTLNIKTERSPEVINPMVYSLPYSDQHLVTWPSLAPVSPSLIVSPSALSSLTPIHPEKLPSMSVTAPSWWPEANKSYQQS